ncbi:MAG: fructokinase [Alphaproteobacteria bacterium HGW-Alphaproteobacteria-13]|nr:MAG: fructokinase [Alphaproteobacteria bacterium HGW-Alphaproteobacteria-13]
MTQAATVYGCIEAGGTKFVLGLVASDARILARTRIATAQPAETGAAAIGWLRTAVAEHGRFAAIGIATFGPAEVLHASPRWGFMADTPKPGWSGADIAGPYARAFGVPIGFDTDVNAAAVAERRWGAAQGAENAVYITVGTGIGGGAVINGAPVHGLGHPEMGHVPVARHAEDRFGGVCPFHGDCLEGLASGPAIERRWGKSLSELPRDHPGHGIIAHYLAQLCIMLTGIAAPSRIVIGGGVSQTPGLIDAVRRETRRLSGGYFAGDPMDIIVPPGLGENSGLLGAFALARDAERG